MVSLRAHELAVALGTSRSFVSLAFYTGPLSLCPAYHNFPMVIANKVHLFFKVDILSYTADPTHPPEGVRMPENDFFVPVLFGDVY